jgi:phage terminase large subunit-like protein
MAGCNGFPEYIQAAYKSGPDINRRDWRSMEVDELTLAEEVMLFAELYLKIPEGKDVGQPFVVHPFQEAILYSIFDNPRHTRRAVVSFARKNGKTVLTAIILLAFMVIDKLAVRNSTLCSGAMAREQAALVFRHCVDLIKLSPDLVPLFHIVPSKKQIVSLKRNVTFTALAKEGSTTVGRSDLLVIGDEWGQIHNTSDAFVEALITSQGAWDHPLQVVISTQAPGDVAMLSQWIDDATMSDDDGIVCWLYAANEESNLMDEEQWRAANPALGLFRSENDLREQLTQASRLPSLESSSRNLLLNQRISLQSVFIAPSLWKSNGELPVDYSLFESKPVWFGLDLSVRNDITAAVAAVEDDDGHVHLRVYAFLPESNLKDKERLDKAPYTEWVRSGDLIAVPGSVLDYEWITEFLRIETQDWNLAGVAFDRWRIDQFQAEAERNGFMPPEWEPVGQGYKDFSPRLETIETLLLDGKLRHGKAPLLNMAAANAIVIKDPAGNRKLDKSKAAQRIDPLIAAVMATHAASVPREEAFDINAMIG